MVHRVMGFVVVTVTVMVMASGCTYVKLTEEGEAIRSGSPASVESCERIGKTNARTRAKIWVFHRSEEKVAQELVDLARDDAAQMGGTDVAPLDEVVDGKQSFGIYRCTEIAGS